MSRAMSVRRISKDVKRLQANPPAGVCVMEVGDQLDQIVVGLATDPDSIYKGEIYQLELTFPTGADGDSGRSYPLDPPDVKFIGAKIPMHEHIYSNGHICLSILAEEWSPALSAESICLSVLSMLASATRKIRPADNAAYVRDMKGKKNARGVQFDFHDDKV